jgi:hypothetical protein
MKFCTQLPRYASTIIYHCIAQLKLLYDEAPVLEIMDTPRMHTANRRKVTEGNRRYTEELYLLGYITASVKSYMTFRGTCLLQESNQGGWPCYSSGG